ncbi:6-phospho-beta-glucosidase [Streptomyces sp. WAC 06738]|uniref:6-phospho-beta-glucosidase n=1 Tax=Streptomyces sp. WAC 06738 TaxID=2203210 RepID=UPI0019D121D8|nr:6-phospho-beta-glucosidase [Streptomyces sp. WAC 06738]
MRLTVLGGGGFRVPLVFRALLEDSGDESGRCTEFVLYDTEPRRLEAIAAVLAQHAADGEARGARPPAVRTTTDLDDALRDTDFVFSAIRAGGLEGRSRDERAALTEGLLGQETVGAGGVLYGLRSVPAAMHIAERVAAVAPNAWVINFTNPAGMVTEAMQRLLGDRVIGICDSPVGMARRAARALGVDPERTELDYVGLNHLGWLRRILVDGEDRLPALLADPATLESFEEGKLFGAEWLQALGSLPNEYLHYYYFNREAIAALRDAPATRGEFLREQQAAFYAAAAADPGEAAAVWERTRKEREATYMAESRESTGGWQRDTCDLDGGGYDRVALALMRAISRDEHATLILNVPNRTTIPGLDAEAVIEVPCRVDAQGAHPIPTRPAAADQLGLMLTLKDVERATIAAADTSSRAKALRAVALHPLVDSVNAADRILTSRGI